MSERPLIERASAYATRAHAGQLRKYTNEPYITHPQRVADRVATLYGAKDHAVAAAWLHDVLEDCPDFAPGIFLSFPVAVADLVRELTKSRPELNRKARKALDRAHIAEASYWARIIKAVDRIDNLDEMQGAASDFLEVYSRESLLLADALDCNDHVLKPIVDELRCKATAMNCRARVF